LRGEEGTRALKESRKKRLFPFGYFKGMGESRKKGKRRVKERVASTQFGSPGGKKTKRDGKDNCFGILQVCEESSHTLIYRGGVVREGEELYHAEKGEEISTNDGRGESFGRRPQIVGRNKRK